MVCLSIPLEALVVLDRYGSFSIASRGMGRVKHFSGRWMVSVIEVRGHYHFACHKHY